jgi:regulatory protein
MRVWEEAPFHEGDELDQAVWNRILSRTNLVRARGIALSLLARSEHSRFLLDRKLRQRDLGPESIGPVLDDLETTGALSDTRFAQSWVRSRIGSHPEGRSHLVAGLRERGVSETDARSAVEQVLEENDLSMADVARSFVERLTRRKSVPRDALATKLYRRGFARDVVNEVLSAHDLSD